MATFSLEPTLQEATQEDPGILDSICSSLALELGATDVAVYLADFEQSVLVLVGDQVTGSDVPQSEEITSTMAGRAFLSQQSVSTKRSDGFRVWAPVMEGSNRIGVLAVTVPDASAETLEACETFGVFIGYLVATRSRFTDIYNFSRRRKNMSLAASIQWDLLPPLVLKTSAATVAGVLEPAYHVGGDSFDYAVNGPVLNLGIIDAMGHGLDSTLLSSLAIGCYRNDRREGRSLAYTHADLDDVILTHHSGEKFVTGQLAELNLSSGVLSWTNAGHPKPLLIRNGKVIAEIECSPTVPWGVGGGGEPSVASQALEPGDSILFFTDGVVEARFAGGVGFGVDRLADLAGRFASNNVPAEEIVRQLVAAVLEHHNSQLADDATLVLAQWNGPGT